uniref:Patellin-3 n=1 Tax=Kalanchoe fedtschenkoi TaxID=63787 RepID=A0A7N0TNJ1_KALFE
MAEDAASMPAPVADQLVENTADEKTPAGDTEPTELEAAAEDEIQRVIAQSLSFKEETNVVGDLPDPQKKALHDLRVLIQDALSKHEFVTLPPPPTQIDPEPVAPEKPEIDAEVAKSSVEAEPVVEEQQAKKPEPEADEDGSITVEAIGDGGTVISVTTSAPSAEDDEAAEEASIWGIPLLADERSDVILLKFLRARDFKVKEAFSMIRNTVRWRKEFKIDELLEEDLGNNAQLDKVVFMKGYDKEGHPICYNVYGEFQNKDLYNATLSDHEKRLNFLRWRIQFLEKSIRKLDFSPSGVSTIVQVNDLKNSPGPTKKELRLATNQALQLLQDNYPEFVAKQVFINVPWWYLAFNRMISPFFTQRTKSKFVFAGPSRTADTLFKYIAPEQVPIQYGGLSGSDQEAFTTTDAATEVVIKPTSKHTIEIPFTEAGTLVWELRVVGWEVSYGAEFVPDAKDSYTVIVQKARKILPSDEPVIFNTFKVGEPGKAILTFDNQTSKKKKLVYRSKVNPLSE